MSDIVRDGDQGALQPPYLGRPSHFSATKQPKVRKGYLELPNWPSGMMINPELVRFAVASLIGLLNLSGISYLTSRDARKISVDEMFDGGGTSVGSPA